MKKILFIPVLCAILLALGSCSSMRHYTYFQNIDTLDLSASKGLPVTRIMPNDELSIIVKTTNPEVSQPFNLFSGTEANSSTNNNIRGYLVDNEGCINFPVLGRIHVGGLSNSEIEDTISNKLKPYLSRSEKPVVICRLRSFRVTMIGELGSKVIEVPDEKINIVQALAQAGDISMYGKRTNVLLGREDSTGEKHTHRFNMNDARVFNDPYYYLKQNDIVYVQPTKQKTVQSSTGQWTTLWVTVLGWATTVASLVLTILK